MFFGEDISFYVPFDDDMLRLCISENFPFCPNYQFRAAGQISVNGPVQANGLDGRKLSLNGCTSSDDAGIRLAGIGGEVRQTGRGTF